MSFSFDKFLRPITATDRNIKIYEDNGILKYTINPFHIKNTNVLNNTMRINLDSDRSIVMVFSTNNEAKISLKLLQDQMDVLTEKVPFIIDKDVLNYVTANIKIGPTGSNGKTFTGTSSTYLTIPNSGYLVQLTTQKDLAFVPGQTIVVYKDFPTNYYVADYLDEPYYDYSDPVYMVGDVDTYNPVTGNLAFVANVCQPVGATSSFWYINLTGQKGKDGTSGTSGASAYQTWLDVGGLDPLAFSEEDFLDSLKGEKGEQGFEGLAGVNGTDGTSGTSGASAYQTWLDVGGLDPLAFSEQEFLDSLKGEKGEQGFEGLQGERGATGSFDIGNGLILVGNTMSVGGTLYETLSLNGGYNDFIVSGFDNISVTSSVFDVVSNIISLDSDDTQILAINDITISAAGQLALTGDSGLVVIGNTQGLVYQSDYSLGFVTHSLVSKKYVDDFISIGTSGTSGIDGTSGTTGTSGTSGTSGIDGTSGTSGIDGTSGTSGVDGTSGTSGISGVDGATSLRWTLENNLGATPSASGKFTVGYNANMISIILLKFAYNSLNVVSEGFWNTIANSILIGNSVYLQVTRANEQNYTALYKVNNVFWSGAAYEIGVDTPAVYGNGQWWNDNEYSVSFSIAGANGTSGTSGTSGASGTSGTSGTTPTTDWSLSGSLTVSGTASLEGHTILSEISEIINVTPGATASTVIYDFNTGAIWYHATASTNYTANFTNMPLDNNRVITTTIMISQGLTGYAPTAVQIGGTASPIKWANGTYSVSSNKVDIVGFTFVRSGNVWSQVFGQISSFG
jgi:hypothetical protein